MKNMKALNLICIWILYNFYYICSEEISVSYLGYKAYTIQGDSHHLSKLKNLFETPKEVIFMNENRQGVGILVAPTFDDLFRTIIRDNNLRSTLEYDDISRLLEKEKLRPSRSGTFSWDSYYDVDDIYAYLRKTSEIHSNVTKLVTGGFSYEGRPLLGLKISTQDGVRKLMKPVVFIESGIHAREWITPAVTTYFINELLTSTDPDLKTLRDAFEWHIFPTVNPDGYHYTMTTDRYWRKTRSKAPNGCYGADPNRNWDHNWGEYGTSKNPCDYQIYAGSEAFSEIETRTLSEYISKQDDILAYISFHSYGEMILLPYSDSTEHCDNYDDLVRIGNSSIAYGEKVNGVKYSGPATAAELIYKASGGSMDWVRQVLGTPLAFTYELRGRFFHWPPERIPEQGKEVTQMMIGLFKEAGNLGYY